MRLETLHLFLCTIYYTIWYLILAISWAANHLMNSIAIWIASTKLRSIVPVLKCLINDAHFLDTTALSTDSSTFFLVKDQRVDAFTILAYIKIFGSSLDCNWSHINILWLWLFFKLTWEEVIDNDWVSHIRGIILKRKHCFFMLSFLLLLSSKFQHWFYSWDSRLIFRS